MNFLKDYKKRLPLLITLALVLACAVNVVFGIYDYQPSRVLIAEAWSWLKGLFGF